MGGRGYDNDVKGYLDGNRRTVEFQAVYKSKDGKLDILYDKTSPKAPTRPIFSNTEGKIYAVIDKHRKNIKQIGFYNERRILTKVIHLDHADNGLRNHVHVGDAYHHVSGSGRSLTSDEQNIVDKARNIWKNLKEEKLC